MTDQPISSDDNPIISPDPITVAAQMMLDNHDAFMAGRACDERLEKRLASAGRLIDGRTWDQMPEAPHA